MHSPYLFSIGIELEICVSCMAHCVLEVEIMIFGNDLPHFQPRISKRIQDAGQYHVSKGNVQWGYDEDILE